ncbi:hypothetical protein M9H77_34067 [Catharanthus roseus]|uniref:Uncharacterized protein n=1 Tax=Catharanthus roseus TaxID=4058 RepID=A0ACB9ZPD0_CATRO|nr:hypothetical protein M9H77_34067 [Catharanthus roseus]
MLCNSGAPRTKSGSPKRGHQNQVPVSRSQYQPNTIRALDCKQPHSHITGQNRLQTPGAPTSGSTFRVKNPSTSSEEALVWGTSHVDFMDSPEYKSGTRILQI